MSYLWPEEDDLLPRTETRRTYDDDQGESSRDAESPALREPRPARQERPAATLSPEFTAAMDKVRQVLGERPERRPTSKWGAIAAMGVGAGAGLVNASGRTHIDPHATQGAIDNLTGETGFRRRDEDWRRRLESVSQSAQVEGNRIKAQQGAEDQEADLRLKRAHAGLYEGQEDRARRPVTAKPDRTILPRGSKLYENGQVVADNPIPTPTPVERNVTAEHILLNRTKYTPEQISWAEELRNGKKRPDAISIAIRAEGGDPDDPDTLTPELSKRVSSRLRPPRELTPNQQGSKHINEMVGSLRMKHGDDVKAAVTEAKEALADDPGTFAGVEKALRSRAPKEKGGLSDSAREMLGLPKKGNPAKKANAPGGRVRVRLKGGKTGTVDASEFDPKTMEKL